MSIKNHWRGLKCENSIKSTNFNFDQCGL